MKIRFDPFTLDLDTRQLTEGTREIHLAPKAFDLLSALIAERPRLISKTELQRRLWTAEHVIGRDADVEIRLVLAFRARGATMSTDTHLLSS